VALERKQAQPSFFIIKNLDGGGWFNVTLSKYLLIEHMIHVVQNMNTSDNKKLLSARMAIRTPAEYHRVHKPDVLTEDASSNGPIFQGAQKRWYMHWQAPFTKESTMQTSSQWPRNSPQ